LAMPSNERGGLNDHEDRTPIDQPRQSDQRDPRRIVGPTRFHLPFDVQSQLLLQKQVFRREMGMRPNRRGGETAEVTAETDGNAGGGAKPRSAHVAAILPDQPSGRRRPEGLLTSGAQSRRNLARMEFLRTTATR